MYLRCRLIAAFLVSIVSLQGMFNWEFDNAVCNDDITKVKAMLEQDSSLAKQYEGNRHTALHWAKSREMAELLVSYGADIYARNICNDTPLHCAAYDGNEDVVSFFLERGMDVNIKGRSDRTPLLRAVENDHFELVKRLCNKYNSEVNLQTNPDGYTALHAAVNIQNLEMIKFLVEVTRINTSLKSFADGTALEYVKKLFVQNKNSKELRSIVNYLESIAVHSHLEERASVKSVLNLKIFLLIIIIICGIYYVAKRMYKFHKKRLKNNEATSVVENGPINPTLLKMTPKKAAILGCDLLQFHPILFRR